MVEERGEMKVLKGGNVHDEKQRTKNGALGDATGAGIEGRESVMTLNFMTYLSAVRRPYVADVCNLSRE